LLSGVGAFIYCYYYAADWSFSIYFPLLFSFKQAVQLSAIHIAARRVTLFSQRLCLRTSPSAILREGTM
jgi:hypothetical protein